MRYYVADAFADELFSGNPAGVCLPEAPLSAELMQAIAAENNLSETAFVVPNGKDYDIRWFTPAVEIDLCGHATLASAFILHRFAAPEQTRFCFNSQSGQLLVDVKDGRYVLNFPAKMPKPVEVTSEMAAAIGCAVKEAHLARDLVLALEDEAAVRDCAPDIALVAQLPGHGCGVTAKGDACDFVSRFFAPKFGVDEDPVTGSLHTELIPFWAAKLGKNQLNARQLSRRGGTLYCEYQGERVLIGGNAVLYLQGELTA